MTGFFQKYIPFIAMVCIPALLTQTACTKGNANKADSHLIEDINNRTIDIDTSSGPLVHSGSRSSTTLHVEAEDYASKFGVQVEACREGGQNVGYITKGDWMDYSVNAPVNGSYAINFRVAGPGGTLQVQTPDGKVLATVNLPATLSGQLYTTVASQLLLDAGDQTIRIYAVTPNWNFNWFELISPENSNTDAASPPSASDPNLLLTSSFEDAIDFKNWSKEICRDNALTISSEVSRKGKTSARFEFTKSDVLNFDGFVRAEIRRNSETEGERWYGFSNYLPADFVSDPLAEKIAQWHDVPDFFLGEDWRSPPISFGIVNDRYYIQTLWSNAIINTDLTKNGEKKIDLGPVDKVKWNDWVFHIKFSYKSDGIIEIWKNKVQVATYYGPNSYNDVSYPYFKVGIYKWGWDGWASFSPENKRVLFYDEVKIGNKNATVNDVSPN